MSLSTRLKLGAVAGSIVSICAVPQPTRVGSIASGPIAIDTAVVPLNPLDPAQSAVGDFHYAGGLAVTSRETNRVHGLSDVDIAGADRLTAVSDFGSMFDARLVLDDSGRLAGLTDARVDVLNGEDGKPLSGRGNVDAEGVALLAGGDRLVSFERRHRIGLYPAGGGPPRPAPAPKGSFPGNGGLEAIAADPDAGTDAYLVGAEESGDTWTCRLALPQCTRGPSVAKPKEFGLAALKRLPGGRTVYLLRTSDGPRARASLQIFQSGNLVARLDLAPPLTVDNFEGVAAVPSADGAVRFYLLSDDDAKASRRTLLLAFDWRPR